MSLLSGQDSICSVPPFSSYMIRCFNHQSDCSKANSYVLNIHKYVLCIYVCMYGFFYSTFTCPFTNYLHSSMISTFTWVLRTKSGVALTTAVDSSIVHTPWKKRKHKMLGRAQDPRANGAWLSKLIE